MSGGVEAKMSMRAVRVRRPAEQVVEHVDQQQARDEGGHANAEGADHADGVVDQGARAECRQHAERYGYGERQCKGRQGKFQRGGQAAAHIGGDRLPGGQRAAQIAGGDVREVAGELDRHRSVQPHLVAKLLDLLLPGARPGGKEHRRVARQDAHEDEGHDDDAEQRRHRGQQARADPAGDSGEGLHGGRVRASALTPALSREGRERQKRPTSLLPLPLIGRGPG